MKKYIENQQNFNTILNKIINNNVSVQAYILVGDINQTNIASILLSKVLMCPNTFDNDCTKCNICKKIDNNDFIDLKIVEPENNIIKKEKVLELRNEFQTKSFEGKSRVYIIKQAEYLGNSAANSILKFLEEPESNVVGIFTTNNLSKVIGTIKSRCQIIKLNNTNNSYDEDYIKNYCKCDEEMIVKALQFVYDLEIDYKKIIKNDINNLSLYLENKQKLTSFFNLLSLIYSDLLNKLVLENIKYFKQNDYFDKIDVKNKEILTEKILCISNNFEKISFNVNSILFLTNFVIEMGEINGSKSNRS